MTHKITRIERTLTSTGKPMWKCNTEDGDKVNIFAHNILPLFRGAGYGEHLTAMKEGEIALWESYPIAVRMRKSGEYWDIVGVDTLPEGASPDAPFTPNLALFRQKAIQQARLLCQMRGVVYFDTETTGVTDRDEIVQFASLEGDTRCNVKMPPTNMERYLQSQAAQVTGIIDFADAAPFATVQGLIRDALHMRVWVIYNSKFDSGMIDRQFTKADLLPPLPLGIHDAMRIFAEFYGEWSAKWQTFAAKPLNFAYEHMLGVAMDDAHDAMNDVIATHAVIRAIAESEE